MKKTIYMAGLLLALHQISYAGGNLDLQVDNQSDQHHASVENNHFGLLYPADQQEPKQTSTQDQQQLQKLNQQAQQVIDAAFADVQALINKNQDLENNGQALKNSFNQALQALDQYGDTLQIQKIVDATIDVIINDAHGVYDQQNMQQDGTQVANNQDVRIQAVSEPVLTALLHLYLAVKWTVLVPVRTVIGMGLGAVGVGIKRSLNTFSYQLGKAYNKPNSFNVEGSGLMVKAAALLPNLIIRLIRGLISIPALTALSIVTGSLDGAILGAKYANREDLSYETNLDTHLALDSEFYRPLVGEFNRGRNVYKYNELKSNNNDSDYDSINQNSYIKQNHDELIKQHIKNQREAIDRSSDRSHMQKDIL